MLLTFATGAACLEPDDEDFLATVDRLNQGLREHAAAWGAPLIDVAASFSNRPELNDDWLHFNDAGTRAHARVVHEAAVEQRAVRAVARGSRRAPVADLRVEGLPSSDEPHQRASVSSLEWKPAS